METVESVLFDSRINRCKKHNLETIVLIVVYATLKSVYGYHKISEFAKQNAEILENYLDLTHGCPSTVTLWRNFERLNISKLIDFIELNKDLLQLLLKIKLKIQPDQSINQQYEKSDKSNLEIIRSCIDHNYFNILEQSNVYPGYHHRRDFLLDVIEQLSSAHKNTFLAVSSDYNSPEMAKLIVNKECEYLLEMNSSNRSFYEQLKDQLDRKIQTTSSNTAWQVLKFGITTIKRRVYYLENQLQWLDEIEKWPKAKSMIAIQEKKCNGEAISCTTKYYLCSKKDIAPEQINKLSEFHFMKNISWVVSFKTEKYSDIYTSTQKLLKNNLKWIQHKKISISD